MTSNSALTCDQVKKAVEAVKVCKPVYAEILDFYGKIFNAQTESKGRIRIEPLQIPDEIRTVKAQEKFPLIEIREFVFDENETGNLFLTICNLAKEANPKLATDAKAILRAENKMSKSNRLFSGLLDGNDALFEKIAGEIGIANTTLGFFVYNALKPSISICADQLTAYLNKDEPWLQGYCPICGSAPILSILEGEGARSLICGFCWHEYSVKRGFCPFCESRDNKTQQYFYNEEEKEYRVDLCDSCKKYLKTIDTRKADRLIYPPLEQISTLHLDIKATEMGFETGVKLYMEA